MTRKRDKPWKLKAHHAIDQFERGARRGRLAYSELAKICGVSRQTLWRSEEVRERLQKLAEVQASSGGGGAKRASNAMRLRELKTRIEELERTNERLIQNLLVLSRALDERGLDAVQLTGLDAIDLIHGRKPASWSRSI